ncbi:MULTISPECIES: hypothetical protein [Butyricimonas]|uniref:hypothetical protein n=1 Tax=Butyricimonas TaxID=574697 RepID=UPI001D063CC3|nr:MULTISPECIES: hypothetical protein [Butyricimonas]MCB6972511.1 hypothetical protein [Butyricimonas synergistica]MCG4519519.1 hypothetical protein [Butyricimonas sp. DFI.6.44]
MEINYKTVATTTTPVILKGINVNLSAEYENNAPGIVTFSCDGHFVEENSQRSDYLNFNGSYDCVNRSFPAIGGGPVSPVFLTLLEQPIMEFYKTIKEG